MNKFSPFEGLCASLIPHMTTTWLHCHVLITLFIHANQLSQCPTGDNPGKILSNWLQFQAEFHWILKCDIDLLIRSGKYCANVKLEVPAENAWLGYCQVSFGDDIRLTPTNHLHPRSGFTRTCSQFYQLKPSPNLNFIFLERKLTPNRLLW